MTTSVSRGYRSVYSSRPTMGPLIARISHACAPGARSDENSPCARDALCDEAGDACFACVIDGDCADGAIRAGRDPCAPRDLCARRETIEQLDPRAEKLGQPQAESNLVPLLNSSALQAAQVKMPDRFSSRSSPVQGRSVAASRSTEYRSVPSSSRHSCSLLVTLYVIVQPFADHLYPY